MTRSLRLRSCLAALAGVALLIAPAPAQADDYTSISGAGSTWSEVAMQAWAADVRAQGLVVNFDGVGSTAGRLKFTESTVDFATSEIPFQNPPEPGQQAEVSPRPYAYLPIVAGGTSFMYNLSVGGKPIRDLRLSGPTLAKIFTGQIKRWSDAAITKDYGSKLPDIPIVPVVRSDGAGASAQFSLYMRSQAPSVYCPFIRERMHLSGSACPSVSFYPAFGNSKGQVGSNGVANYVAADYGVGSIGYVEYAYAKRVDFPVVSLLNKAGYYAQPTAANVAVALTKARINSDKSSPLYLTQELESVYNNPDPRTYPMSSYSYMIIPTTSAKPFDSPAGKGKTLSTFINYFLCAGQQKADILGYSPLPQNLVQAGFDQVKRVPGAVASPPISQCKNPALDILKTAPQPDKCAKVGADCTIVSGGGGGTSKPGTAVSGAGAPAAGGGATTGAVSSAPGSNAAAAAVDPLTGAAPAGAATATGAGGATATPVTLTGSRPGQTTLIGWLVVLFLVLTVFVPPFLVGRLGRR